jgi:hypothetical protein
MVHAAFLLFSLFFTVQPAQTSAAAYGMETRQYQYVSNVATSNVIVVTSRSAPTNMNSRNTYSSSVGSSSVTIPVRVVSRVSSRGQGAVTVDGSTSTSSSGLLERLRARAEASRQRSDGSQNRTSGGCRTDRSLLALFGGQVDTGSPGWTFPVLIDGHCPISAAMLKFPGETFGGTSFGY